MEQQSSPGNGDGATKKNSWRGAVPPPVPSQYQRPVSESLPSDVPPVVKVRAQRIDPPRKKASTLDLEIHTRDDNDKLESRGWLSSVLIHVLIFALIALIVAPANFGGDEPSELIMTLGDAGTPGLESSFELEVAEDPGEVEPVFSDEADVSVDVASIKPKVKKAGGGGGGQEGPRGSFYGIEATGHEFVYILDMSGSMRGSRYRMACEELIRSVGGLQPSQRFYVLLFSDGVVQMFNENSFRPNTLAANLDNRTRLATWLKESYGGGSTDPREALRVALRMDPSCVFMLSDGEFKYDNKKNKDLMHGTEDAFDIVKNSLSGTPIHAIAFQDPSSCENMKRLASITKGKYRFVSVNEKNKLDLVQVQSELDKANRKFRIGDLAGAKTAFEGLVQKYPQTENAWEAREKLARMTLDSVQSTNASEPLLEAIRKVTSYDPNGIVSSDIQKQLYERFIKSLDPAADNGDLIIELAKCFTRTEAKSESKEQIGVLVLNLARADMDANKIHEAHEKLDLVTSQFPNSRAARQAGEELQKIVDRLMEDADQIRKARGNVSYVRELRSLIEKNYSKAMNAAAQERLNKIQKEMLARVTNARRSRNADETAEAVEQLQRAFDSKAITNLRKASAEKELRARGMLRAAQKLDRPGASQHQVITRYENIGLRYPGTVAARKAFERIKQLQADASGAELTLEMLIEQGQ